MDNFEYISSRLQCADAEKENAFATVMRLCTYAAKAHAEGPLSLEPLLPAEPDPFLQDSLRRVVDAENPETLREALQIHILAANASGNRFLEMMVIADGVYQLQKGMHPHALLSRLGEWFGDTYRERFITALAQLDAEEKQRALQARAKREAEATQIARAQLAAQDEVLVQQDASTAPTSSPAAATTASLAPPVKAPAAVPTATDAPVPQATAAKPHAAVSSVMEFHQLGSCRITAIERLLKDVDDRTLAAALKGVDKPLFSLFWSAMPKDRCEKLLEDMSSALNIRTKDVEEAQTIILNTAKALEQKQELTLDFPDGELLAPHWEVIL